MVRIASPSANATANGTESTSMGPSTLGPSPSSVGPSTVIPSTEAPSTLGPSTAMPSTGGPASTPPPPASEIGSKKIGLLCSCLRMLNVFRAVAMLHAGETAFKRGRRLPTSLWSGGTRFFFIQYFLLDVGLKVFDQPSVNRNLLQSMERTCRNDVMFCIPIN